MSQTNLIASLSRAIGTTEPALRLTVTILTGYPLALIFRKGVYNRSANVQHLFFILTAVVLAHWNYGLECLHLLGAIAVSYVTLFTIGGTALSVAIVFVYNMVHLLLGYYYNCTDSYDINWTLPQCILVLRLIGVAFDLYDGHQPAEKLGAENKRLGLQKCPTVLEFFGHALFPASFLVGPQFPMKRYQDFVAGKFNDTKRGPPDSTDAAIRRFALGLLYLAIFQTLGFFVSDDYMASEDFASLSFPLRLFLLGLWGRFTLYKYIFIWLLTEGACILFGISHNGTDETTGSTKWNGVENIKLGIFENVTEFTHYILSFNVNTNQWSAHYIYKRLKFLGDRLLSQLFTLMFLAVWHGLHSGYYVCFFFEFAVVYMEREVKSIVKSNKTLTEFFANPSVAKIVPILLRAYTFVFMGWCLLPFALLQFPKYWQGFGNVYHIGTLVFVLWPIVYGPLLRIVFKRNKDEKKTSPVVEESEKKSD